VIDACMTYTVEEVATILGVLRNAVYAAIHRGEIPRIKVGGRIVITKAFVDRLLAEASGSMIEEIEFPLPGKR